VEKDCTHRARRGRAHSNTSWLNSWFDPTVGDCWRCNRFPFSPREPPTRIVNERWRRPWHRGSWRIVRWCVRSDGTSAGLNLGRLANRMASLRYPGRQQPQVCNCRSLQQLRVDSELKAAPPAPGGERPAVPPIALPTAPPASGGERPAAPPAAACGSRGHADPRGGLESAYNLVQQPPHVSCFQTNFIPRSSGSYIDVQFGGRGMNLTLAHSSSSWAPQVSQTRATGWDARARTAGKKTISNQDWKRSPSIHALILAKYGSGHGRRGGLKQSGCLALPIIATGISWVPVASQAKTRVTQSLAFIALVPRSCHRWPALTSARLGMQRKKRPGSSMLYFRSAGNVSSSDWISAVRAAALATSADPLDPTAPLWEDCGAQPSFGYNAETC